MPFRALSEGLKFIKGLRFRLQSSGADISIGSMYQSIARADAGAAEIDLVKLLLLRRLLQGLDKLALDTSLFMQEKSIPMATELYSSSTIRSMATVTASLDDSLLTMLDAFDQSVLLLFPVAV